MAVKYTRQNGKQITLLNPSEKGSKCAAELRNNIHLTNDGIVKTDKNGVVLELTTEERAYRAGYLAAQKDSANCWKAKQAQQAVLELGPAPKSRGRKKAKS